MKLTLNVLKQEEKISRDLIQKRIINKDPVIFIIPIENHNRNLYSTMEITEDFNKFTYILDDYSLIKIAAFLFSFHDLEKKNVLVVSSDDKFDQTKQFLCQVLQLLKNNHIQVV